MHIGGFFMRGIIATPLAVIAECAVRYRAETMVMASSRSQENLSPPGPDRVTPGERVLLWQDLLNTSEEFLLAGFRRTAKSEAEVLEMYRNWYDKKMLEHDQ